MNDFLNPIAEIDQIDSGDITTPEEAIPLKSIRKFFCPDFDCKDPKRRLSLKKSKLENYFFCHHPGYEHEIRPETLLHKLAIRWFVSKSEFEVPERVVSSKRIKRQILQLDTNKTLPEYSRLKLIKPDVKLYTVDGFEFAIEIVVTHDLDDSKKKLIDKFGLPTVRIDLSFFYKQFPYECRVNKSFVEKNLDNLPTNVELKKWVISPSEETPSLAMESLPISEHSQNTGCMWVLMLMGFLSIWGGCA